MSDYFSKYLNLVKKEINNYRGAGFVFYMRNNNNAYADNFSLLLGVDNKSNKNLPKIDELNVFGGKKEKTDKNPLYTAVRETFEELFNTLPTGLDFFTEELQKKINDGTIIEKVFVKEHNEICYFADISILYTFINHLVYQKSPWTFKGNYTWEKYQNNINLFINDRCLKNNQKVKSGFNEIKRVYLIKWSDILKSNENEKIILINNKKLKLRDNLNRYVEEKVILDILNKNI